MQLIDEMAQPTMGSFDPCMGLTRHNPLVGPLLPGEDVVAGVQFEVGAVECVERLAVHLTLRPCHLGRTRGGGRQAYGLCVWWRNMLASILILIRNMEIFGHI